MYISNKLTADNLDKLAKKYKLLGNSKHLRIILLLKDKSMSLDEIHKVMAKNKVYSHRETTYKALEKMVGGKLINKEYDVKTKKLLYSIKQKNEKEEI